MISVRRPAVTLSAAALLAVIVGCAADAPAPAPTPTAAPTRAASAPATPSPPAAGPQARTLEITVNDGRVSPPPAQVDLAVGETLRLQVTSDRDSEIHAHGFEVDAPVPAGTPTGIDLTGTAPGVYEVELHDPDLLLLQVAVR